MGKGGFFCDMFLFSLPGKHYIMWSQTHFTEGRYHIMELKIATRSCQDPSGVPRHFHYFLTVDQVDSPRFACENYGVRIAEEAGEEACCPALTTSASRIDELMTLLVDNKVGPAGLADVVADWL